MDRAALVTILVLLFALGLYGYRMARSSRNDSADGADTGAAIIDFSRAFPNEAIRSLHMSIDGDAVFVRLHDNRAGFMKNMGNHYACLLLNATMIDVQPLEGGDGLAVTFNDWPKYSGEYRFHSQEEAADVALWLLASLQAAAEAEEASEADSDKEDLAATENETEAEAASAEDGLVEDEGNEDLKKEAGN